MRILGDGSGSVPGHAAASWPRDNALELEGGPDTATGTSEYLLCHCGDLACAIALRELREVMPTLPAVVPLPFSPQWLLGIFAWRTELAALVDPAPLLLSAGPPRAVVTPEPTPLAATLIAGDDEQLFGLGISRLGNITALASAALGHTPPADAPLATSPFVRGWYAPGAGDGTTYAVLDLPAFLNACLLTLETEAAHA